MLDREKYNLERERALKAQMTELSEYIYNFMQTQRDVRERPINTVPDAQTVAKIQSIPIGRAGRNPKEVGDELVHTILESSAAAAHPRFFSFVTGAVSPYSLAGSVLTDLYSCNAAAYMISPGPTLIEEKLVRWAGERAGFDGNACGGIFTSGGSLSNLTGMIAARENKLPGRYDLADAVAFCSTQAHSSIKKGMRMMGLRDDQIVLVPTDGDFRIRTDLLEDAIKAALAAGKKPFLLVGSVGTTNTGSIDPLDDLADLAERYGLWLHVDGAFGGSILVSDIYKNLAKGIERADSFSWDFHKWLMQIYSCSCIVAKDKNTLKKAFAEHPEYLADVMSAEHNDGWDLGIEMSRPARYLKLWYTVQAMGTDLLADIVDYAFYNANTAAKKFSEYGGWEIVSKPMCGTVNVRYAPASVPPERLDELNAEISAEIMKSGYAYIVTTTLNGHKCLRLCMINGSTETCDVLNTVEKLNDIAAKLARGERYRK